MKTDTDQLIQNITEWAEVRGILNQATLESQLDKLDEEFEELSEAIEGLNMAILERLPPSGMNARINAVMDAIGDMAVVQILMATMLLGQGNKPFQKCIEHAYQEIKHRKGKMVNGVFVKER